MEVPQLQALVSGYPWFSYAREVLLCKLVEIEPQCLESVYKEGIPFLAKRERVLLKLRKIASVQNSGTEEIPLLELLDVCEDGSGIQSDDDSDFIVEGTLVEPLEELGLELDEQSVKPAAKESSKYIIIGGDYFTKEDFAQLDQDGESAGIRFGSPAVESENEVADPDGHIDVDYDSSDFITETLAGIYADQGYYDKAIEVYAKLILLYPEKNTYFATLVNEIKSKNQIK